MIALSLSGGGSRAAGFHLGVLDCLDRLGMRDDVKIMSSASGGSFVCTTYALAMQTGESFRTYLQRMYTGLDDARMVEWVLQELAAGEFHTPSRRRAMITSLANVYDRQFFRGARLGAFLPRNPAALREAIFNATDFRTGSGFRFQIRGGAGNHKFWVDEEDAAYLRMADIMAASSCIPGGLEPFFFPQDFNWNTPGGDQAYQRILTRLKATGVDSIPLMDGGVYDNQGINSTLIALSRIKAEDGDIDHAHTPNESSPASVAQWLGVQLHSGEPHDLDLFIVSDTSVQADPVYRAPYLPGDARPLQLRPPVKPGRATVATARIAWWLLFGLCVLTLLSIAYHALDLQWGSGREAPWDESDFFLVVMPLLLTGTAVSVLWWLRGKLRQVTRGLDNVLAIEGQPGADGRADRSWSYVRKLKLTLIAELIGQRATSIMSLVNDIFFDRVRALSYTLLEHSSFKDCFFANELRDLASEKPPAALPWLKPSPQLLELVQRAQGMPTIFWFEHPDDLQVLIACGHATTYFNVLKFYAERAAADGISDDEQRVFDAAREEWQKLNQDPMSLVAALK
jgi:predicted acylesterase/phospholipase RssA